MRSCGSSRSRPSTATRCSRSRGRPRSGSTGRSTPARARRPSTNWFERCLHDAAGGGDAHFATILQATGAPVGSTSFCTAREHDRGLEIGWTWLTPAAWGTGANTEAKFLQLRYAFEQLGCIRVDFDTYAENARSRAALAKLPAQFEGVWRNYSIRESDGSKALVGFLLCDRR